MKKNKLKELQYYNNKLGEMIKEENQAIFTDIVCYIKIADISEYNREIVRRDISEMIIDAQNRGEDIDNVIGGDYKEFCDSIIESLPKRTAKERIIEFFDIVCLSLSMLSLINIISRYMENGSRFYKRCKTKFNYGNFIRIFRIDSGYSNSCLYDYKIYLHECICREKGTRKNDFSFIWCSCRISFGFVLFSIIIDHILKGSFFTVNIFLFAAFAVILYIVHIALERI